MGWETHLRVRVLHPADHAVCLSDGAPKRHCAQFEQAMPSAGLVPLIHEFYAKRLKTPPGQRPRSRRSQPGFPKRFHIPWPGAVPRSQRMLACHHAGPRALVPRLVPTGFAHRVQAFEYSFPVAANNISSYQVDATSCETVTNIFGVAILSLMTDGGGSRPDQGGSSAAWLGPTFRPGEA